MARLTHPNGSVVNVSDDKVGFLLGSGFSEEGAASVASSYGDRTVDELKDEIRKRNDDGRDDETRLALTGTKAELIASLEADDT